MPDQTSQQRQVHQVHPLNGRPGIRTPRVKTVPRPRPPPRRPHLSHVQALSLQVRVRAATMVEPHSWNRPPTRSSSCTLHIVRVIGIPLQADNNRHGESSSKTKRRMRVMAEHGVGAESTILPAVSYSWTISMHEDRLPRLFRTSLMSPLCPIWPPKM